MSTTKKLAKIFCLRCKFWRRGEFKVCPRCLYYALNDMDTSRKIEEAK